MEKNNYNGFNETNINNTADNIYTNSASNGLEGESTNAGTQYTPPAFNGNEYYAPENPQSIVGADGQQTAGSIYTANGEQNGYYSSYNYSQSYVAPKPKKEKKNSGTGKKLAIGAVSVAAVMVLSFGCGFAGSFVGNSYFNVGSTSSGAGSLISQSSGTTNTSVVADGSIESVVNTVAASVVEITTESVQTGSFMQQYISTGAGSGVIMSEDGYIVTNNHVIENANKITVKTKDGTEYTAKLIGTDEETDLAVIKIEATGLTKATAGVSAELAVGQTAIAIGNPLGSLGGTVTTGIISALDREITIDGKSMTLLQTNAAINPGNSGGGLFDASGKLIGVVNAKSTGEDVEGLGFAIPIDVAVPVINSIIENGYVTGRANLGVTMVDISSEAIALQYRVSELGVYIYSTTSTSAATLAGLQPGDRIVSINGKEVSTSAEVSAIIKSSSAGDQITIVYERNGEQTSTVATLQEKKS